MPKTFRIIALSLVGLAVLLGIIALAIGRKDDRATPAAAAPQPDVHVPQVVVAVKDLPAGVPVALEDLQTIDAPGGNTAGYYTSPLQAKGAIPTRIIPTGTQLRPDHFLRGLSSHLYPGERAVAIGIDEVSAVGSHIEPGDYVDVYLNLGGGRTGMNAAPAQPTLSRLLASRLRVLAIGSDSVATSDAARPDPALPAPAEGGVPADQDRAMAINERARDPNANNRSRSRGGTAVLAVSPDDAATLLVAAQEGRLTLSLRNPADPAVANRDLFRRPDQPAAQKLAELSADDRAYLGVNSRQLVAPLPGQAAPAERPAAPARRRAAPAASGVQIIRGSDAPRPLTTN